MEFHYNNIRFLLILLVFSTGNLLALYDIRVLLQTISSNTHQWVISSSCPITIYNKKNRLCTVPSGTVTLERFKNNWKINNRILWGDSITLASKDTLGLEKKYYAGTLEFIMHKNTLYVVNAVPLEDYVTSVLRTEGWPGWPLEINKVLAIVSRTYGIAMREKARQKECMWDVSNTNMHQTYSGIHTDNTIKEAVAQTAGKIITYNKKPIIAMFDCCCGGVVPADIAGVNFKKNPYLARTYPCLFCRNCSAYRWKKELPLAKVQEQLHPYVDGSLITHMRVSGLDKAGLVTKLSCLTQENEHHIDGKIFYKSFKEVKSYYFRTKLLKDSLLLMGKGIGHHLGLCQWGAREMVRQSWTTHKIISFYYPGTRIITITALNRVS